MFLSELFSAITLKDLFAGSLISASSKRGDPKTYLPLDGFTG